VKYNPIAIINWDNKKSVLNQKIADGSYNLEQSLPIALFITAYARILMSDAIKNVTHIQKKKIYMTDTDSLYMNSPLSLQFIGKEIGKFKKEFSATEAIFPAPKLYYLVNSDGVEVKKGKGIKRGSLNHADYITLKVNPYMSKRIDSLEILKIKIFKLKPIELKFRQLTIKETLSIKMELWLILHL
jgi:hypothetical protein